MPAAAIEEAVQTMQRAAQAVPPGGAPPREEPRVEISESASADEIIERLSQALARVPGIGRYREARLQDLASRGPRIARGMWDQWGDRVDARYREMSVGEVLDRFAAR
jgi:hypothetical protein